MAPTQDHRRGMTLPELLVVVAIIGLLAVTVLPVLSNSRQKTQAREAADALSSHLSQVAAQAMDSRNGSSAWYEAEISGAGGGYAMVQMGFGRVRDPIPRTTTVTPNPGIAASGSVAFSPALSAALINLLPAPIEFAGIPALFTLTNATQITSIFADLNRTAANSALPRSPSTPLNCMIHLPPRLRKTASTASLPNGMAVDLRWSSIGVEGFTTPASRVIRATGVSTDPRCMAITFDRTGRADRVWFAATPITGPWQWATLDSATPVALLVGPRANAGNAYVASPSEDDPGANWQNPDARWVVVDPRTSLVRLIETNAKATTVQNSLRYVVESLSNTRQQ
jgi:prepilin-type N-terminal cleavage/methylation domain-containing protein